MYIKQFFVKGLSNMSYVLGGKSSCAVIDPSRDVEVYLDEAERMGFQITHILETHLHADFISGHLDLARLTGAKIVGPRSAKLEYEHLPVGEGDEFEIDHLRIKVLETPGHTPEHLTYVVTDSSRGADPVAAFTGDTLFVGDVGRPDLFPGMADELAGKLFDSIKKIMALPDFVEVYPAHGAGSLCGKAMSGKRNSTVGYERRYNKSIQPKTLEDFKSRLLSDMPQAPDHFSRCSAINGRGPTLLEDLPAVDALEPEELRRLVEKGAVVLDVRDSASFGGQHVAGAINIDIRGNFATFAGWLLPPDREILLVASNDRDVEKAIKGLLSVGLDRITGWLDGGMFSWNMAGLPFKTLPQASVIELKKLYESEDVTLVDVRSAEEFNRRHVEGAINIPVPDNRTEYGKLKGKKVYVMCSSGHRSSAASSILQQKGIEHLVNVPGGMTAWSAAGFSAGCPRCSYSHGPRMSE